MPLQGSENIIAMPVRERLTGKPFLFFGRSDYTRADPFTRTIQDKPFAFTLVRK